MIYAGEQGIVYPIFDLYDKQLMQMSIAAAKDMYEKGQKQIQDFNTKYGDFMSPIAKDMEWYDKNVTGKVRDTINNLYANGIDPLRSAEGRAAISQLIYSMPTGDIAKVRQSAEAAKEYIKNRGKLQATGAWDPDFERFANNGQILEDWDTMGNGVWNRTSPSELKTLKEVTEPWYNQRTAHILDKAGVESFGIAYDPKYNYMGFTDQDLLDIAAGQTPGWNGSIYADYYRDVARRKVQAIKNLSGDNSPVTSSEVEKQLQQDIAIANREYKIAPTKEADQFVLDDYRTRNDIRAHAANKAIDHKYWQLEHDGGDSDKYNRIFRRAEQLTGSSTAQAGDLVQYTPQEQYSQWIDPVNQGGQRNVKLESGEVVPSYVFSKEVMKQSGSIYKLGENNKFYSSKVPTASGDYTFVPDGNMRARYLGNKNGRDIYKYYISGMLLDPNARTVTNNGDNVTWIAVKERDHNYGQNQKKE